MLFIFMMTYKCHVTKMSGAIRFKKESIETLKIYHKTATYTACKSFTVFLPQSDSTAEHATKCDIFSKHNCNTCVTTG